MYGCAARDLAPYARHTHRPTPLFVWPQEEVAKATGGLGAASVLRLHTPAHHIAMATAASQPYIAKLGFSDPDRSKDRHGLACEYLLERLIQTKVLDLIPHGQQEVHGSLVEVPESEVVRVEKWYLDAVRQTPRINVPIKNGGCVVGFADVLVPLTRFYVETERILVKEERCVSSPDGKALWMEPAEYGLIASLAPALEARRMTLGEVKISPERPETVLQQINFYRAHVGDVETYILTDYDPAPLKRLVEGSNIHVYRLGERFEQWIAERQMPVVEEL